MIGVPGVQGPQAGVRQSESTLQGSPAVVAADDSTGGGAELAADGASTEVCVEADAVLTAAEPLPEVVASPPHAATSPNATHQRCTAPLRFMCSDMKSPYHGCLEES